MVGGHCIGVDPYYLTYKAESIGYRPKIILAGRELNDNMGKHVVSELIKEMKNKNIQVKRSKILIMGLTFKENCSDIRNSGIQKVITELKKFNCTINLYDPWVDKEEIIKQYDIVPNLELNKNTYDGIIVAVAHQKFKKMGIETILSLCKTKHIIFDLKNLFNSSQVDLRL